jgi:HSP20 family protein
MYPYNPWREALSLRRAMDQLFERSFVHAHWGSDTTQNAYAPMDVCETAQGYEVCVSLPGVKPKDIDVTVHHFPFYTPFSLFIELVAKTLV